MYKEPDTLRDDITDNTCVITLRSNSGYDELGSESVLILPVDIAKRNRQCFISAMRNQDEAC
jgi:hypothetical protein